MTKKSSQGKEKGVQRKKLKIIKNRQIKMIENSQGKEEKLRKRTEEEEVEGARLHSNSSVLSSKRS